ncbi:MAG: hypothetical protein ACI9WU_005221, partial [Myxococcota bacterium]
MRAMPISDQDGTTRDFASELVPLIQFMEEGIPFNKYIGLKVLSLIPGQSRLFIPAAPHLVGDPFRPAIHGGVISTIADVAGGAALFAMLKSPKDRVSTVDLRIDYLQPGLADKGLVCECSVLRMGNKVAVTRMEIFSEGE